MKRKTRVLSLLLAFMLVLAIVHTPLAYAIDSGEPLNTAPIIDRWAVEDVTMARVYGLEGEEVAQNYRKEMTMEEVAQVGVNLYLKLSGNEFTEATVGLITGVTKDELELNRAATREDTIVVLYNAIKASQPSLNLEVDVKLQFKDGNAINPTSLEAVKYAVAKEILRGKSNNALDLSANITRQELLALARRAYESVIQDTNRASKGLFYKVSQDNTDVYILGSIHIADSSLYPLNKSIIKAFNSSDYLAVEANIAAMTEEDAMYINSKAVYMDGTTIDQYISEDTLKLLIEKLMELEPQLAAMGIPLEYFSVMKPWFIALLLQNLSLAEASYVSELGVDMFFLNKAMENKNIIEIEGARFQIDLFDNFSPELQEQFLLETLKGSEVNEEGQKADVDSIANILSTWKSGDAKLLEEVLAIPSEDEELEDFDFNAKFWHERNKHMTETVITFLTKGDGKTFFVVVGAGHLVGDTGIIKALRDRGYTVEQILE